MGFLYSFFIIIMHYVTIIISEKKKTVGIKVFVVRYKRLIDVLYTSPSFE